MTTNEIVLKILRSFSKHEQFKVNSYSFKLFQALTFYIENISTPVLSTLYFEESKNFFCCIKILRTYLMNRNVLRVLVITRFTIVSIISDLFALLFLTMVSCAAPCSIGYE